MFLPPRLGKRLMLSRFGKRLIPYLGKRLNKIVKYIVTKKI